MGEKNIYFFSFFFFLKYISHMSSYNLSGEFINGDLGLVSFNIVVGLINDIVMALHGTINYNDGTESDNIFLLSPDSYLDNDNIFYPFNSYGNNFTINGLAFEDADNDNIFKLYSKDDLSYVNENIPLTITQSCIFYLNKVLTIDGYKPISEIKIGDKVISNNDLALTVTNVLYSGYANRLPYKIPQGMLGAKNDLIISVGHAIKVDNIFQKPEELIDRGVYECTSEDLKQLGIEKYENIKYVHLELENGKGDRKQNYYIVEGVIVESYTTKK